MTVEILGTKVDDSYVEMVSETVDVIPWETVYEETDELAPGEKQEIQTPYTGYVVQTWRNVYAGDGSLLSSTFEATSNYESRDRSSASARQSPESHTYCLKSSKEPHPQVRLFSYGKHRGCGRFARTPHYRHR